MIALWFGDAGQRIDELGRYRVCWTRSEGVGCARRTIVAGSWDEFRLLLRPGIGRTSGGRREVAVTWYVDGRAVASRRVSVAA